MIGTLNPRTLKNQNISVDHNTTSQESVRDVSEVSEVSQNHADIRKSATGENYPCVEYVLQKKKLKDFE